MTNPAAWHPDPTSAHEYRWWDGTRWTEHVADGGQASVDPLPGAADPGATSTEATGDDTDAEGTGSSASGASASSAAEESATGSWQQPGSTDPAATAEQPAQDHQQSWQQPEQSWQQPEQSWQQPTEQGAGGGQPPAWQQTPAWSQPGGEQPAATGSNGIAIAAMVVGIVAILISWIPILGALAGILALVLGFIGRGRFKKSPAVGGSGPAITGIVTGIVATLISVAVTIALFAFGATFMGSFETYEECLERGGTPEECQEELERDILDRIGQ